MGGGGGGRWCLGMAALWGAWAGFDAWVACWERRGAVVGRLRLVSGKLGDGSGGFVGLLTGGGVLLGRRGGLRVMCRVCRV